jgi:probable HAF family extracellular repeat protein
MSGRFVVRFGVGSAMALTAVLPIVGAASPPAGAAAARYSIVDIGSLGGANGTSAATAINAAGDVVGWSELPQDQLIQAVIYKGGSLTYLGALGSDASDAEAINSSDAVVGTSIASPTGPVHAVRFSGGTATDLNADGSRCADARGINDAGAIVGYTLAPDGDQRAVRFNGNHSVTDLSDMNSAAMGVSKSGIAVGFASSETGDEAVTFSGGTTTPLPAIPNSQTSAALAIGQLGGYAVGHWQKGTNGQNRAIEYTLGSSSTSATDLGAPPDGRSATAFAVNDTGQAVGWAADASQTNLSALLFSGGKITDLNTLLPAGSGWTLEDATGINDAGQIVGWGIHNGVQRGFMMTPAPSPPTRLIICRPPYGPLTGLIDSIPTLGPPIAAAICQITGLLNLSL